MRIAIVGYGKMGREIEAVAREQGETIAQVFDIGNEMTAAALMDVDVCIDFSMPSSVLANIRVAAAAAKDIVVGTTGWLEHLPEVRQLVQSSGLLYSANFSLGMNIFLRIVTRAAELMNKAGEYDPFIHEAHHNQKLDSPSGTALRLADIIVEKVERKTKANLNVAATRAGVINGIHTVGFDSEADLIELRHTAKSRRGFALGALAAARWLHGRKGIYTMDDVEL